ncbi:hypothetical protein [Salinarchaeum chitinilyticum]
MPRTVTGGRTATQGSRERGVRCCPQCSATVQRRSSRGGRRSDGAP